MKVETALPDEPRADELTFTVANTGAVPITISDLALVVYPNFFMRLLAFATQWHRLNHRRQPKVCLPKLLVAGEEWTAVASVDNELLDKISRGRLCYKLYVSHRRPLIGKIRRPNLLHLLRM